MVIYLVTNKINGLRYIGQTIRTLDERKEEHLYKALNGSKYFFHRAIKKYGIKNFEWEIIHEAETTEELNELEVHYIKEYNTFLGDGYNLTIGGRGCSGWKHSEEAKKKISEAGKKRKGIKLNDKTKKKIGEYRKGKTYAEIFGEEKANEILDGLSKNYIEKFGEEKANKIKNKISLNNKSSDLNVREKMSKSHKRLLDENGKRTNISESGRYKMVTSKLKENNPKYITVKEEISLEIISEYMIKKKVTKKMSDKYGISIYLIRRILKERNLYGK